MVEAGREHEREEATQPHEAWRDHRGQADAGTDGVHWATLEGLLYHLDVRPRPAVFAAAYFRAAPPDAELPEGFGCCAALCLGNGATAPGCTALSHHRVAAAWQDAAETGQAGVVAAWADQYPLGEESGRLHREVLLEIVDRMRFPSEGAYSRYGRFAVPLGDGASLVVEPGVGAQAMEYDGRRSTVSNWRVSRQSHGGMVPLAVGCCFVSWAPLRSEA